MELNGVPRQSYDYILLDLVYRIAKGIMISWSNLPTQFAKHSKITILILRSNGENVREIKQNREQNSHLALARQYYMARNSDLVLHRYC